jgi:hypothetical protein
VKKEVFTILVGGSAGNGVKKIGAVASSFFASLGRHVFEMEDYQSLIKGGTQQLLYFIKKCTINCKTMQGDIRTKRF